MRVAEACDQDIDACDWYKNIKAPFKNIEIHFEKRMVINAKVSF